MTEPALHWLSPGDPAQRTGGSLYNARVVRGLRALGLRVTVHRMDADWPVPAVAPPLPSIPAGAWVVADGLLLTGVSRSLAQRADLTVVGLIHSPLWRERGVIALRVAEATALRSCALRVATSLQTANEVADDIDGRVVVIEPGTEPVPLSPVAVSNHLLCPAHLIHRKGHGVLLTALATLMDRGWTLDLVGRVDAEPETAAAIRRQAAPFGHRVRILGQLDGAGMDAAYRRAGLVVLPSHYEAFGMVLTEAVARGRPVLCSPAGAVPLLGGAARVLPAGDIAAWAAAIARWLDEPPLRASLGLAAQAVAPSLPTWSVQAQRWAKVLSTFGWRAPP